MLGQNPLQDQQNLFSYRISLEQRVGPHHPLRQINSLLDLSFVVPAVRDFYGRSGNVSVDPVVILKLMFLLFYYNLPSERELMEQLAYRIDFLWFLGYNLDSPIPDHSVLSKARARWGTEVFKNLFLRTVQQCVQAGLVDGRLLHLDSTIVKANAAKDSITQLPAFLSQLYAEQERKLEPLPQVGPVEPGPSAPAIVPAVALTLLDPAKTAPSGSPEPPSSPEGPSVKLEVMAPEPKAEGAGVAEPEKVGGQRVSLTDPDAQLTRAKNGLVELSYKEHRLVDDAHGVITAVELTRSQVYDGTRLPALTQQHEHNTQIHAAHLTLSGDQHYGTLDNYRYCHERGICAHMAPAGAHLIQRGNFPVDRFTYEPQGDRFRCPAGHCLTRLQDRPQLQHVVYRISQSQLCAQCPLREQCTHGQAGRTLIRHYDQPVIDQQRQQSLGPAGRYSRQRRKHKAEGSFADAANNHGMKRARWRRLWRQQIQTWMICAVQNLRLLVTKTTTGGKNGIGVVGAVPAGSPKSACQQLKHAFAAFLPREYRQRSPRTTSSTITSLYRLCLLQRLPSGGFRKTRLGQHALTSSPTIV